MVLEPRPERYEMELPIRYHMTGSDKWVGATTVNVSRSGVLARPAAGASIPSGHVDFVMALPPCGVVELARIRCSGHLVRVGAADAAPAFALSIDRYEFMKPGDPGLESLAR